MTTMSLTPDDLAEIGAAFVATLGVQAALGHVSAGLTARDYIKVDGLTPNQRIVRQAFVTTCSGPIEAEAAEVAAFVERHGLLDILAETAAA